MSSHARMWTELTGMKIEQIVLFVSTKPGFSQVFVRKPEDFEDELTKRINRFHSMTAVVAKCKHGLSGGSECTRCLTESDLLLQ